ncbi:MAG: peptidoglycan recognition family protein [Candidatus Scalindua sp.]|jgi:N-acetyl-anhydromuramyl-L-alanine amidase AmpD|nr:peptidoglycan recognition family protein [Candidatus Scalindua sp.]MDV5166620.1 peptidoglycan recognition family protein [Candidatus Scalindua sp.]
MKIVEWHVITVSVAMFVAATGLFVYLPFISINKEPTVTIAINIDELCRVDVEENKWKYVVLHHSATDEGNADNFDKYHRDTKKWEHGLAYHFVIGNGNGSGNGEIEVGDRWKRQIHGAHTANMDLNRISIGICLVGNFEADNEPTNNQLASLVSLVTYFSEKYHIPKSRIVRHSQVLQKGTACPGKNFPYKQFINEVSSLHPL